VGRLRLLELGKLAAGLDYAVASKAITRFSRRLAADADFRERLGELQEQLSRWQMTRPGPIAFALVALLEGLSPRSEAIEPFVRPKIKPPAFHAWSGVNLLMKITG